MTSLAIQRSPRMRFQAEAEYDYFLALLFSGDNIIVAPRIAEGWYIIDPNPDDVFNSPLID